MDQLKDLLTIQDKEDRFEAAWDWAAEYLNAPLSSRDKELERFLNTLEPDLKSFLYKLYLIKIPVMSLTSTLLEKVGNLRFELIVDISESCSFDEMKFLMEKCKGRERDFIISNLLESKKLSSLQQAFALIKRIKSSDIKSNSMHSIARKIRDADARLKFILDIPDTFIRSQALEDQAARIKDLDKRIAFIKKYIPADFKDSVYEYTITNKNPISGQTQDASTYNKRLRLLKMIRDKITRSNTVKSLLSDYMDRYSGSQQTIDKYLRLIDDKKDKQQILSKWQKNKQLQTYTRNPKDLSIMIDDFEFILLYKTINDGDTFVYLISIHQKTKKRHFFAVYRSRSEIGTWRYCLNYNIETRWKGIDYVATTYIHMDLQRFLTENYTTLPDKYFECKFINPTKTQIIESRKYVDKSFQLFNLCEAVHYCFYDNKAINKTKEKLKTSLNDQTRSLEGVLDYIQPDKSLFDNIKFMFAFFSLYLDLFFKVVQKKSLYTYSFSFYDATFDCHIYEYEVLHPESDKSYLFFVNQYTFTYKENTQYNGSYRLVQMVVDKERSKINEFGLYESYFSSGILSYKALEYISQLHLDIEDRIVGSYYFIGDLMELLWSFTGVPNYPQSAKLQLQQEQQQQHEKQKEQLQQQNPTKAKQLKQTQQKL